MRLSARGSGSKAHPFVLMRGSRRLSNISISGLDDAAGAIASSLDTEMAEDTSTGLCRYREPRQARAASSSGAWCESDASQALGRAPAKGAGGAATQLERLEGREQQRSCAPRGL